MLRPLFFFVCLLTLLPFGSLSMAQQVEPCPKETLPSITVEIPMRDGVKLPTDIYMPEGQQENLPTILVRTPAGRKQYQWVFTPLAEEGYAVVIQDTRNLADLEGKTMPLISDGWGELQDGYDTVEWLANSPYSNGKIGTAGFSIMGITQVLMAPSRPPHLECQYIGMVAADMYSHVMFNAGCLLKHQTENWAKFYAPHPSVYQFVSSQRDYNDFWKGLNTVPEAKRVNVPGLFYTGWYDVFLQGTIDAFSSRQEHGEQRAKEQQKLIIGPWTHYWPLKTDLMGVEVPKNGLLPPYDISPLQWFDHYLKGKKNGISDIPAVTYYVMGPFDGTTSKGNRWKTSNVWPIPAKELSLYFREDGRLSTIREPDAHTLAYTYDPKNPTPTIGGRNLFLPSGPADQTPIEQKDEVVVFTTPPLRKDLEVTGRVQVRAFLTTDQPQTDLSVRLSDVYPDGKSLLITDGMAATTHALSNKVNDNGQTVYEMEVDLQTISMVFAEGHQIRLSLSSSNYPRYDRSLNGASSIEEAKPARNNIHFGSESPSRVLLPIIKD